MHKAETKCLAGLVPTRQPQDHVVPRPGPVRNDPAAAQRHNGPPARPDRNRAAIAPSAAPQPAPSASFARKRASDIAMRFPGSGLGASLGASTPHWSLTCAPCFSHFLGHVTRSEDIERAYREVAAWSTFLGKSRTP